MTKKSRRKFKYLKNEKSIKDGTKRIFHDFKGLSLKQIKQFFLEGDSSTLRKAVVAKPLMSGILFPTSPIFFLQTL